MVSTGHLSDFEKGQILALQSEQIPLRTIAEKFKKATSTVSHFSERHRSQTNTVTSKNALKLVESSKQLPISLALTGNYSAHALKTHLNLKIGVRPTQQNLRNTLHIKHPKVLKGLRMTSTHCKNRPRWARRHIRKGDFFRI